MIPLKILAPVLKAFFRLLYYEFAWSYDLVAWFVSAGKWQSWIAALLPFLDGQTLLELGHGPGHLQKAMAQQGRQVFGLDRSPFMSRQARSRLEKAGLPARLVNGNAQAMPFDSNAFDQVFATFPSEYVVAPETMAETLRILKPGGQLLVLPAAWITGRAIPERLAAVLFFLTGQSPSGDEAIFHPAVELLRKSGFVQIELKTEELPGSRVLVVQARKPAA